MTFCRLGPAADHVIGLTFPYTQCCPFLLAITRDIWVCDIFRYQPSLSALAPEAVICFYILSVSRLALAWRRGSNAISFPTTIKEFVESKF